MVDFSKLNPDRAKEIINALKDGKINANEAKQLGLTAQEAEALNKAFSSGEAQIGDFVLVNKGKSKDGKMQYSETQKKQAPKEEKQSWWDKTVAFAKDNAGALVAGALVVGGGALCLTGLGSGIGAAMIVAGAAMGLTSCSSEDDIPIPPEINNNNNVTINISIDDQQALIDAFKEGIDALMKKIDELGLKIDTYGDQIIKLLTSNNSYLKSIAEELKNQGEQQDEIIKILTNINSTCDTIKELIEATNENITVNGESIKGQLTEILNAIKNGQAGSTEQLNIYMEQLKELLKTLIEQQGDQIEIDKDSNLTLNEILAKLDKMEGTTGEKLEALLEILKNIESIGNDINNKLDVIIGKFENAFPDNSDIKASLERIEQYLKENNEKTDVTNNLLTELLNKYQSGGLSQEDLQKLLDAIAANGDKIDVTNQLLTKYGEETAIQLANILAAIKNINVGGGGSGADIEALLDKVLAKMDENTAAIIDAIGNIKPGTGGTVDLSSLEKMLAELLELTGKNNNILTDINGKMDVLNLTTKSIEEKLEAEFGKNDERYTNICNLLEAIKNQGGSGGAGFDDSKLLEKLDKILNKLDDILAAIKDHKVTVDVTGKVECNCNCGGNHEGIIGDLEDILG